MKRSPSLLPLLLLALAGCSPSEPPRDAPGGSGATAAAADAVAARIVTTDLGDAVPVAAARTLGSRDDVLVTGRIAAVVDGFAVFTLMDTKLPYCGEQSPEDDCATPWDYCCESPEDKRASSLLVELRGDDDRPLRAAGLPGLRLLDEVEVAGRLATDDQGNPVLLAARVHQVARPALRDGLRWPR